MTRDHDRPDTAARPEFALHFRPFRSSGPHYVFQYAVDDVLLEDPDIAIAGQIFLQRLQFQAILVGHVADPQDAEVGQTSLRAYGCEFWDVDHDFVVGELIRPGLDFGKSDIQTGLGMLRRVARAFCHAFIVAAGGAPDPWDAGEDAAVQVERARYLRRRMNCRLLIQGLSGVGRDGQGRTCFRG